MALNPNFLKNQTAQDSILDNNNRQVYLGNAFVAATPSVTVATTAETPVFLVSNPATSGKSIFLYFKRLSDTTTTTTNIFKTYFNPTVTAAGTTVTPVNLRSGATLTSLMSASTLPTTSANGTFLAALVTSAFAPLTTDVLHIIDPGNSYLITATTGVGSTCVVECLWYEM